MSSITSHFRDINLSEKLHQALDTAVQYVTNPTTQKVANAIELLGFAEILRGTIDFAQGKKLRGTGEIIKGAGITGAASIVTGLKQEYDNQSQFSFMSLIRSTKAPIRGLMDKIMDSPMEVLNTIKDKATERAPTYLMGAGAATSIGGAIDFARGNKKRGALVALTGAAAAASSYFLKV